MSFRRASVTAIGRVAHVDSFVIAVAKDNLHALQALYQREEVGIRDTCSKDVAELGVLKGDSALTAGARRNSMSCVMWLLNAVKFPVSMLTCSHLNGLREAASSGHVDILRELLVRGARLRSTATAATISNCIM